MRSVVAALLLLVLAAVASPRVFADEPTWNWPAYRFVDGSTIALSLVIKLNGMNHYEAGLAGKVNNVSGICGELHYNSDVFFTPRARPGENASNVRASGFVAEPGVLRFSIYATPVSKLPQGSTADMAAAEFLFSFDRSNLQDGQFTWHNCQAAKYRDLETGTLCREKFDAINLAPIEIHNAANDWCLYE